MSSSGLRLLVLVVVALLSRMEVGAEDFSGAFDAANKLYEQGNYPAAAAAYEHLIQSGQRSETLYFNLGDAWFKAGQLGRAIAAWRQAEFLSPRDPALRFNLQFTRKKVSGSEAAVGTAWSRVLRTLTLNEWTRLTSGALWVWFVLLALREVRPVWRVALSGYTATAGGAALLLAGCVAAAAHLELKSTSAVVTVPEAIVRSGPLEEAKVLYHFRDGVEVDVLDEIHLATDGQNQTWLQVRDTANHTGWVKNDQVVVLRPRR